MTKSNGSLRNRLDNLSKDTLEEYLAVATRLREIEDSEAGQKNFLKFINSVWPDFIEGSHHRIFAQKLQDVADGKLKRLIVNMPPRHYDYDTSSRLEPLAWAGSIPFIGIFHCRITECILF